ncbi:MAG: CoA-disulfide reductase [Bacillota bacterium]|nr:CoA-disulfide reductase [Bacillota bacterium]
MKVIIIGGVAAGMSAASKLKRMDKEAEVVVYEKGVHLSYGACGLPYYVGDLNDDYKKLILRTKEDFEKKDIKVNLKHEVVGIEPDKSLIKVINLENGEEFEDNYDKLMIATGASPIIPPFPGKDLKNIFTLNTIEDGLSLKEEVMKETTKDIVVVGGGYIGIELAEVLANLGKNITVVEMAPKILMPFDQEISDFAHEELEKNGVKVKINEKVEGFEGNGKVEKVKTDKGEYNADLVIMSVGIKPNTKFLENSGIKLAKNGAVDINREMKTSIDNIYAAGDCALVYNMVKKENSYIALGTNANKCGKIAGENLAGENIEYKGTLGSSAIKVHSVELARTGLSEKEAEELGYDYKTKIVTTTDKPHYYPGGKNITFKLIYEKDTNRLLGVQGAGEEGVVLRMDVFALAIENRMATEDLGMSDFCYAPPFSTAWDAINIAGNASK